jgi:hypothetical protein
MNDKQLRALEIFVQEMKYEKAHGIPLYDLPGHREAYTQSRRWYAIKQVIAERSDKGRWYSPRYAR